SASSTKASPPSRRRAVFRPGSVSNKLTSPSGGTWFVTSCVPSAAMPAVRSKTASIAKTWSASYVRRTASPTRLESPMPETSTSFLPSLLLFLGAAVVAVPLFKRLGLGAIVGYLVAGVAIGPSGFRLFTDTGVIVHIAELGVVLLLFVIGLELQLPRLLSMRKDIFGLGATQLATCGLAFALVAGDFGL